LPELIAGSIWRSVLISADASERSKPGDAITRQSRFTAIAVSSCAIFCGNPALSPPVFYVRETNGAKCLAELFPQFRGWGEAPLRPLLVDAITSSSAGTAFLATPHEVSAELAPACSRQVSASSI